jgi:hypothetical protein
MTRPINRNGLTLAAVLLLACAGSGWLTAGRDTTPPSTYAMMAAVLTAMVAMGINVWKNGWAQVGGDPLLREAPAEGSGARSQVRLPVTTHERISNARCAR